MASASDSEPYYYAGILRKTYRKRTGAEMAEEEDEAPWGRSFCQTPRKLRPTPPSQAPPGHILMTSAFFRRSGGPEA